MPRRSRLAVAVDTLTRVVAAMRRSGRIGIIATLVLVAAGCSTGSGGSAVATVLVADGLEVASSDGWDEVEVGDAIPDGARVRTAQTDARLTLTSGEVWLAGGSLALLHRDQVDVIRGETLVASEGSVRSRWGEVEVVGTGVYRLASGITPRVAVYDGTAEVRRPAEARSVGALRELDLALHRLPVEATPLTYHREDPWDRVLLAGALTFDAETARMARGIDRQFGTEPRSAEFYEAFVAVRPGTIPLLRRTSRRVDGERFGPPSDALLTLFVSQAVAGAFDRSLDATVREVATLRSSGARWGLVAVELGIGTVELARSVDLGQERRTALGIEDGPIPAADEALMRAAVRASQPSAPSVAAADPSVGASSDGDAGASAPPRSPQPPARDPDQPDGPPPPGSGGLVDDTVDSLERPIGQPLDRPSDTVEDVGDVVGETTDAVSEVVEDVLTLQP